MSLSYCGKALERLVAMLSLWRVAGVFTSRLLAASRANCGGPPRHALRGDPRRAACGGGEKKGPRLGNAAQRARRAPPPWPTPACRAGRTRWCRGVAPSSSTSTSPPRASCPARRSMTSAHPSSRGTC
eukprot:2901503-Prymnesium_polylepis.2